MLPLRPKVFHLLNMGIFVPGIELKKNVKVIKKHDAEDCCLALCRITDYRVV